MSRVVVHIAFLVLAMACLLPAKVWAQGETTSAILGEVRDATGAVVARAAVTVVNRDTGLKRRFRPTMPGDSISPS